MIGKKFIVGLTGQTGAGKSSVCSWLTEKYGINAIDCDAVSRDVTSRSPSIDEIADAFGKGVLNSDGTLNRRSLGHIVFSNGEKLSLLNKIVHPRIIDRVMELCDGINGEIIIFDAPTLIESGLYKKSDIIVSVTADAALRKKRIMKRDGITSEEAERRIDAQKSEYFYTKYSDISILNTRYIDDLHLKSDRLAYYIKHIRNSLIKNSK